MKRAFLQLSRYAIVGLASNLIGYLLYLLATAAGVGPKLAMTLLYGIGVLQTFVFNKRWTFGHQGGHRLAFIRYCTVYGVGYLVNFSALLFFVDRIGYPHQIVQGVMILLIAGMLFLAQRYWVFAQKVRSDLA